MQRRQHANRLLFVLETLGDRVSQNGVRTDFQCDSYLGVRCDGHCVGETYTLANIFPPVFGIKIRTVDVVASDSGNQRGVSRTRLNVGQRSQQFITNWIHLWAMKRVFDLQPPTEHTRFF